jgi:hypothetical protein
VVQDDIIKMSQASMETQNRKQRVKSNLLPTKWFSLLEKRHKILSHVAFSSQRPIRRGAHVLSAKNVCIKFGWVFLAENDSFRVNVTFLELSITERDVQK